MQEMSFVTTILFFLSFTSNQYKLVPSPVEGGEVGKLRQATVITCGKVSLAGLSSGVRARCHVTPLLPPLRNLRAGVGAGVGAEALLACHPPRSDVPPQVLPPATSVPGPWYWPVSLLGLDKGDQGESDPDCWESQRRIGVPAHGLMGCGRYVGGSHPRSTTHKLCDLGYVPHLFVPRPPPRQNEDNVCTSSWGCQGHLAS